MRMKLKLKRVIAFLAIATLLAPMVISNNVYATGAGEAQQVEGEQQVDNSQQTENEQQNENDQQIENEQQTENEQLTDKKQTDEQTQLSESEEPENLLINYAAIEYTTLFNDDEQSIAISLGEGDESVTEAVLTIIKSDGTQHDIPVNEVENGVYKFSKVYTEEEIGLYALGVFSYKLDGYEKSINLEDIGIEATYTVSEVAVEDTEEFSEDVVESVASSYVEDIISTIESSEDTTPSVSNRSSISTMSSDITTQAGNIVVVLDPGHGGSDPGASANGVVEKVTTLKIAQYCKAELEKYAGVDVYMTRTTDVYVGLSDRVTIAANYGADLFVSIHNNSHSGTSANGTEVYYPNTNYNSSVSQVGKDVAQNVLNELVALGMYNRGIKVATRDDGWDSYAVIRESKQRGIPAILIEHAFISNAADAAKLASEEWLKKFGVADATAIAKYYGLGTTPTVSVSNKDDFAGTATIKVNAVG
ncbi:MAG: N-acetylmuramoyl-L-alanine amidase, partial [Suipraeoptans sp.]